jgi:hypothetical protein
MLYVGQSEDRGVDVDCGRYVAEAERVDVGWAESGAELLGPVANEHSGAH